MNKLRKKAEDFLTKQTFKNQKEATKAVRLIEDFIAFVESKSK